MNEVSLKTELTCPVCLDIFEDPLILPCVHSYCKKCLENLLDSSTAGGTQAGMIYATFKCPQCKQMIHLDERRLDSLPKNFQLSNIVTAFSQTVAHQEVTKLDNSKKAKTDKIDCSVCEKSFSIDTIKVCLHCCSNRYCKSCFRQYHPNKGVFKRHVVLSVTEMAAFKGKHEFCNVHLLPCIVLCKPCDKAVCPSCCVIGAHKTHAVEFYGKDGKPQETTFCKTADSPQGDISITPTSNRLNSARAARRTEPTLRNVPRQRPSSSHSARNVLNVHESFNQRIQELDAELGWGSGLAQPNAVSMEPTNSTRRRPAHTDADEMEFPVIIVPNLRVPTRPFTPATPEQNDDSWLLPCDENTTRHRNLTLRTNGPLNIDPTSTGRSGMDSLDDALHRFMSTQRFRRHSRR